MFGYGNLIEVFVFVDLFEMYEYDGLCYFDYKLLWIEDFDGVWVLVVVNMCMYLFLKECVVVFCVDLEV